jgi:hypothetical protein
VCVTVCVCCCCCCICEFFFTLHATWQIQKHSYNSTCTAVTWYQCSCVPVPCPIFCPRSSADSWLSIWPNVVTSRMPLVPADGWRPDTELQTVSVYCLLLLLRLLLSVPSCSGVPYRAPGISFILTGTELAYLSYLLLTF